MPTNDRVVAPQLQQMFAYKNLKTNYYIWFLRQWHLIQSKPLNFPMLQVHTLSEEGAI